MATEKDEPRYKKDDYTLKQWDRKIEEEHASWHNLGISLDNMNISPSEFFFLQCKMQAVTNCILEDDLSEENLNLWYKLIIMDSMQNIREAIEPQIQAAKLAAIRGDVQVPEIIMPWDARHPGNQNKRGNGGT